ncbi:MFS transporter [Orrella daihaiensis]|uniref:MFS transporter n=1 Tax=Orrella daihaiensis TaxID=2782176 RepID=A0ABY4AHT7_9BURK|nr:MFS transporter [Orrella daihaiensis]UOD49749.1 MFS transporter [Orrella daihaiensis]
MIRQWPLAAYSALALPLAMAMLPIYMMAPKYYSDSLGVSLTALGVTLFAIRLIDTVQDPFIGRLVDRLAKHRSAWAVLMVLAAIVLALSFALLFMPSLIVAEQVASASSNQTVLLLWLAFTLVLVYTAHSCLNVCYLAWGARLTDDQAGRARVTGWREASGVIGVVAASVLPVLWAAQYGETQAYAWFALVFAVVLMIALVVTLLGSPRPILVASQSRSNWRLALKSSAIRRLYWFYLFNATSAAIPATLILFFVDDVLQAKGQAGLFLGVYFLAGLLTLPLWVRYSDKVGKRRAWAAGAVMASMALMGAALLGAGDIWLYVLVCAVSGAALGADLALPPAMLADAIAPAQRANTGLYFGFWALIAKFSLALAAGAALPLLGGLGYVPGEPATAGVLSLLYAILPVAFKVMAAWVIWPAPTKFNQAESLS